jgi:hypothetical protein
MNDGSSYRGWFQVVIGIVRGAAPRGLKPSGLRPAWSWGLLLPGLLALPPASNCTELPLSGSTVQEEILPEDAKTETKQVTGQLVMVRKNKISVEYATKEDGSYEMLLPITSDVRFKHVRGLEQLQPGDTVTVEFEQTYRDPEDGERVILNTVAKEIQLVKHAVQSPGSSQGE